MNDLKSIKAKAWSLPPGETRGELVGIEQTKYSTFKYYYDKSDESYWYQSESTERFHKEMKENEKERKLCLRESGKLLKRNSA